MCRGQKGLSVIISHTLRVSAIALGQDFPSPCANVDHSSKPRQRQLPAVHMSCWTISIGMANSGNTMILGSFGTLSHLGRPQRVETGHTTCPDAPEAGTKGGPTATRGQRRLHVTWPRQLRGRVLTLWTTGTRSLGAHHEPNVFTQAHSWQPAVGDEKPILASKSQRVPDPPPPTEVTHHFRSSQWRWYRVFGFLIWRLFTSSDQFPVPLQLRQCSSGISEDFRHQHQG